MKVRSNGIAKLYDITPELYMDKKFWVHEVDVETQKVRKRMRIAHAKGNADSRNLERTLNAKVGELLAIINEFEAKGLSISHQQLANRWRTSGADTLCEFIEMRINDEAPHLGKNTVVGLKSFLASLQGYDPNVQLADVNSDWLLKYENYLRFEKTNEITGATGLKQNSVVFHFNKLKKYFRYADLHELIPRNPMLLYFGNVATKRRFQSKQPITETLTALDIDILHNAFLKKLLCDKKYNGMALHYALQAILTTIYTGLRISDIRQLYFPEKIEVSESHISLTMIKVKRRITIKITNRLREIIRIEHEQPILEGRLVAEKTMNRQLDSVLKHLGIKKFLTYHDLRRSFATQLQANKVDIKRVSKLLGHSSVTMTEKYVKVRDEDLDKAMDSWDQIGKGSQESEEVANVLDVVAEMVKLNPGIKVPEELLGMLAGRIPEQAGIWKVS